MAGKVRLTEAQKVTLRVLNRGAISYDPDSATHQKLKAIGFASNGGNDPIRDCGVLFITPSGRAYIHGAHK